MRSLLLTYLLFGLYITCNSALFGQGGETAISAATNPLTLPFNGNGTTAGAVNDTDNANSNYDNGPDWYYYFCAANSTPIYATINFTPGGVVNPISPSLTIIEASSGSTIAIAQGVNPNSSALSINFTPTSGNCYYLIVDNGNANGFSYQLDINNNVIANNLPGAIIFGATNVCLNSPAPAITFSGNNSTGPYTFVYTINGGPNQTIVSSGNSVSINCPTSTADTFTYSLVSVSSVDGFSLVPPSSQSIVVEAPLSATITGTATVCQYSSNPTITFTGSNGSPPYTFTYTVNNGPTQTINSVGNMNRESL